MKNKFCFLVFILKIIFFAELNINKNNSVITVLAINNYYVPYVSVMIDSIIQNAKQKRKYEIYILYTNISLKNKEILNFQIKKDQRFSVGFINVTNFIENKKLNIFAHLNIETYFRFLIFDLFPISKKILYLDSDLIINTDISELYDINIEGKYLTAVKDIDTAGSLNFQYGKRKYINVILLDVKEMMNIFKQELFCLIL